MAELLLRPSKSTYISNETPDKNFSLSDYLYMGTDPDCWEYQILLEFDLCLLPKNILITEANLRLYSDSSATGSTAGCFTPYAITSIWDETQVTWDTQPTINKSITGENTIVTSRGWYNWDITNISNPWLIKKNNNHGLLLKAQTENIVNIKRFFTYNQLSDACGPSLNIEYETSNTRTLCSRCVKNSFKSYRVNDKLSFSSWQNTSTYNVFTFFVQNMGPDPVNVFIQMSPDRGTIHDDSAIFTIEPCATEIIVSPKYTFFTRLAFKQRSSRDSSTLKVWFQAQV